MRSVRRAVSSGVATRACGVGRLRNGCKCGARPLGADRLRLPRTLVAAFVGAALATSGAMMQDCFAILLPIPASSASHRARRFRHRDDRPRPRRRRTARCAARDLCAAPRGVRRRIITTLILVAIASRHGQLAVGTLLLAGIAVGAFAASISGIIVYVSDDRELRDLTLWSMGSLSGASWQKVLAVVPFAIVLAVLVPRLTRGLNGFLLGEAEAMHLGIDTERTKRIAIAATAAAVGAAVAVAGVIGFVGLVVPHIVRLISGTGSSCCTAGERDPRRSARYFCRYRCANDCASRGTPNRHCSRLHWSARFSASRSQARRRWIGIGACSRRATSL